MKPKIDEQDKGYYCHLIHNACDGDLAQTDRLFQMLREAWTVAAMQCIADQLTAAGYEW